MNTMFIQTTTMVYKSDEKKGDRDLTNGSPLQCHLKLDFVRDVKLMILR